MVFPKELHWNITFLVLSGKMIFLFPENMILPLDGKWKVIFLKKVHEHTIFSSNVLKKWRWSFQKGLHWDMIFLVLSGKMVFFPENMISFRWAESERWSFSRNTWKYDIFCVHVLVLLTWHHAPPSKKNQRWSYPTQTHLKVIEVLDWHSRTSSSNSLYFHGDFYRPFHVLFSSEKNQET